jgi:hypothetical protein
MPDTSAQERPVHTAAVLLCTLFTSAMSSGTLGSCIVRACVSVLAARLNRPTMIVRDGAVTEVFARRTRTRSSP